ncbi:MAG: tyrosine-type recombinase/integrase [Pseudomonadota bacterium]|nr:tyrosine-type recombinase/integrase [Pseudomonadota bacterium]
MRLVFASEEFQIGRTSFVGFPLLIDSQGELSEPAFSFLVDRLLDAGGVQSKRSWPTYGYALLHYFRFLEQEGRLWDERQTVGVPSIVASYREWAIRTGVGRSTTRDRVDLVCAFYEYAVKHGFLVQPPFTYTSSARSVGGQMPGSKTTVKAAPAVRVKVPKRLLKVLSVSEVRAFLEGLENRTHHLMAKLQIETGIRVEELVSFPLRYIFDPRTRPEARHFFAVRLDPSEMATKGSVERVIHLPRTLMAELWAYASLERNKRFPKPGPIPTLFVTEDGGQFATRSVWEIYARTKRITGFHVNPHALRHTYATHTLAALSKVRNQGSALLYIRNRLGHSSVVTTAMYCHYVDDVAESLMAVYQSELFAALDELQQ